MKVCSAFQGLANEILMVPGKQTWVGQMVKKIVDNVQIYVTNIHMRYEDASSTPEVCLSLAC